MCFNQLLGLFLLLICLVTNIRMDLVHAILYRIARTVAFGLDISSAHFLANMDDPHFNKSRSRWDSFAEAVDSENQFGGFKLVGKNSMLLRIAHVLGRGSLNAGTFVVQVFHWFYVGRPRATTSYRACVNVLLASSKVHLRMLKKLMQVHSIQTVFDRCKYRSHSEATQNYIRTSLDLHNIRQRVSTIA